MNSPPDDVRRHERDWVKLAAWLILVAVCLGIWIGIGLTLLSSR